VLPFCSVALAPLPEFSPFLALTNPAQNSLNQRRFMMFAALHFGHGGGAGAAELFFGLLALVVFLAAAVAFFGKEK
jgi:hypothetical protein